MQYQSHVDALVRHLEITPFLSDLAEAGVEVDPETWGHVVTQAGRMAEELVAPLDPVLDRQGAQVACGRVRTAPGHREAWARYAQDGWLGLPLPEAMGGMGLPLLLQGACEELLNRASPAFAMLATPGRTAAELLLESAAEELAGEWVPRLLSGEWAATICISEPDAGSDVGRIRTRAVKGEDGAWRVTGEKCWISYGDHDLAGRIGHFMLARSGEGQGVRGLGLFLVPDGDGEGARGGVFLRRIEEKLGLHGSPTCVLGFENAPAVLIGQEGRGLQTLFHMMLRMRLSCGPQGIGVASGAFETALRYAQERRQGGAPDAPPVPIAAHADVQRMLLGMAGRIETARGLALACATALELGSRAADGDARAQWLSLAQFLLPIVKDGAARLAFDVASEALQVLGGAGYTCEWPVEQRLRDARVFSVFEGTSGIQAIDMLHRRLWREEGEGLARFLAWARGELRDGEPSRQLAQVLDLLERTAADLSAMRGAARGAEAGATAFLDLCGMAACGWMALRLVHRAGDDAVGRRMKAAARFHLAELPVRAEAQAGLARLGAERLEGIAALLD
ncbi:acyl-CoA dehydrogenase family protein [Novosphingobium aerophilum]|uniref:acyl-CoA dehydrogenase family protein n=1 Tax=Novosphingobium aerophilum TaxID=2839843 RepID=UPI003FD1BE74